MPKRGKGAALTTEPRECPKHQSQNKAGHCHGRSSSSSSGNSENDRISGPRHFKHKGKDMPLGLSWVKTKGGDIPDGAIETQPGVYVCRALHEGEQIPGKYVPRHALAFIPYGGVEQQKPECEVLCDTKGPGQACCYEWLPANGGNVPKKAMVAGFASRGEPLYIAKALVGGEIGCGKVHTGHSCAYMPFAGTEHSVVNYEVLVGKKD